MLAFLLAVTVCGKCHQDIYRNYLGTRMANASGPAVEGLETGSFQHAASGVRYRVFLEGGAAWLSYERPGDPEMHGRQKLEYFMGSGNHGRTYLYSINGYWFETPIAWYARKHGYDMRPAYLNDKEMPFNLPMNASCLRCHVSGAQVEDAGTRDHYSGPPFMQGGIICQPATVMERSTSPAAGRVQSSTRRSSTRSAAIRSASAAIWRAMSRCRAPADPP